MPKLVTALANPKFPLGRTVITAAAEATLDPDKVMRCLTRHAEGDWGEVCYEDALSNDDGLQYGSRLLSVFGQGGKRFWIITESDRSVTTVLLPQDY